MIPEFFLHWSTGSSSSIAKHAILTDICEPWLRLYSARRFDPVRSGEKI
jgi:hypothetical protein